MSEKVWQRARNSTQVEQRAGEILGAVENLFRSMPYDKITMQKIAREASFTQSNIYRYFKTKEEVFLSLYITDITELADRAALIFYEELSIEDFADKWTGLVRSNERFLDLSPLLAVSLERNSSGKVYRQAKLEITHQAERLGAAVFRARPGMSPEQVMDFIKVSQSLIAGAWPMSRFTEEQLRIIDELNVPQIKIDFFPFFRNAVLAYLIGLGGI